MKVNKQYIQKLLEVFEKSEKLTINLNDFKKVGFNTDEEFAFHMMWLNDKGFVRREDLVPGIGYDKVADGTVMWSILPLRYTASGGEYLEELRKTSLKEEKMFPELNKD